ncbi:flagellar motor switch protein FliN [Thermosulfurimonas marina]|uniref:Flagellar motor switch protein FliN n=1 Tax=Thermosulfurimonas marina TaxID=2047767 RepID=A0A6H1WQU3_9BACT|nr:flagellar motor switch protein FliN [Thermosulfurimonas marina]QJA05529.1 flagellar motor switch protein FliN [Thermosulfurimonas marina]
MAEELQEKEKIEEIQDNQGPVEETPEAAPAEEKKEGLGGEDDLMAMWEEALKEAGVEGGGEEAPSEASKAPAAEPAKLEEFREAPATGAHPELELILDIPLEVSVEIGRTKMILNDLLKLTQGSIIELNKMAGEPVEIYVNGRLMARGEVVVVNDRFGVRLTEIISPQERVKKLGEE